MRVRLLSGVLAVFLAVFLVGCGSDDSGGSSSDSDFHVTTSTPYGDVEVDAKPERVVVLSLDYLEATLALGIEPVGAPTGVPYGPWITERIDTDDTSIFAFPNPTGGDFSAEAIAALEPDLIVGSTYAITQERYDELSKVAPTIAHDDDAADTVSGAWEDLTTQLGEVTGTSDKAASVVEEAHDQIDAAKAAAPQADGKTLIIAALNPNSNLTITVGEKHSGMRLMQALGFTQTDVGTDSPDYGGGRVEFSLEEIGLLDEADLLVYGSMNPALIDVLTSNELFKTLDVVTSGHSQEFDTQALWSFNTPTALNIPYLIEQIQPLMNAA